MPGTSWLELGVLLLLWRVVLLGVALQITGVTGIIFVLIIWIMPRHVTGSSLIPVSVMILPKVVIRGSTSEVATQALFGSF